MGSNRYWPLAFTMILVGAALRYPAFGYDFAADDYAQIAMMEGGYPSPRHPLSLFSFSTGEREDVQALMDAGFFPWFSHPELRLSMFRPLASAMMWIDHGLFGRWAPGYHIHSLLWWLALLLVAAWTFRRLLGDRLGLLATLFFVLDEVHGVMMGWIANRNAMVSALLGLLALTAHVRARERGEPMPHRVWIYFLIALTAGEYTLCMLAYFVAFELVERHGDPVARRLRALAPLLALSLGFLVLRSALGFGSHASDLYIDPTRDPLRFLAVATDRLPVMISDLVLTLRADWWSFGVPPAFDLAGVYQGPAPLERWRVIQEGVGWVGLLVVGLAAVVALRGCAPVSREVVRVRWLLLGALLSVVPPLVTAPGSRSLVGPALGFAALLALLSRSLPSLWRARRRAGAALAAVLVAIHVVLGTFLGFWDTAQMPQLAKIVRETSLGVALPDPALQDRRVIFLSSAEPITPTYFSLVRRLHNRAVPRSTWLLCPNPVPYDLSRTGPATLEAWLPHGTFLGTSYDLIFRTSQAPVGVGHRFVVDGMAATVLELRGGHPSRMRFDFEAPLHDSRYVILAPTPEGLRPYPLPPIGQTVRVPRPVVPVAVLRD